ncbi:MAG: sugar kinase [Ancrocorticia sp.]|jgi:2-dehydro-3-deoxygluconokinase|nr:sugar kinase [Ancrocorticia sp.]MCI2002088.1 sugar kinase [Ancrocorticia sp.]MCI2011981.1 sugar kinase [Ancrocorticia sp.]
MSTGSPQENPVVPRNANECEFDIVSLGEVMLRLDPGESRIRTARRLDVWEGGGEYNVARGLSRCFGKRAGVVTALADNEVGHLIENMILAGGVNTSLVTWKPFDGVGRVVRNGLNFTERGFGVRGAVGVSDRGTTAISQLAPEEVDWDDLFGRRGVRWFHTGGIFAALSETSARTARVAMETAKRYGTIVSYDLNYRPSLWKSIGGVEKAREVNRELAQFVDVMIGNEEDFTASLGFDVDGVDANLSKLDTSAFERMIGRVSSEYKNFKVIATTLRQVRTATLNDWAAVGWSRESGFVRSVQRPNLEILDRVGGGDSFASGLVYGLLEGKGLQTAIEYGAAHGALAMTTPGDTSMATLAEVERLVSGGSARVQR